MPNLHAVRQGTEVAVGGDLAVIEHDGDHGHRQEGGYHRCRRQLEGPLEDRAGLVAGFLLHDCLEIRNCIAFG